MIREVRESLSEEVTSDLSEILMKSHCEKPGRRNVIGSGNSKCKGPVAS